MTDVFVLARRGPGWIASRLRVVDNKVKKGGMESREGGSRFTEEAGDGLHLSGCIDLLADEPALATEGVAESAAGLQLAVEAFASPGGGTEGVVERGKLRGAVGAEAKGVFHDD